ncbi:dTDP-4-amino-4,6-dideoxygalactose transaminase [Brevibacterium sanguinis]|uniref:dTDP-4-amino-4,6-dideoxygalactose transaminase n=2 Tax=Brevibacterium TaxID=1696 RepID=A0A366ILA6_9MICO|nr:MULTISPECIES: aminotransferase class I/II-fold pyridoxal phosphate-dependent enzyme [Brevibacterium]RBP66973.1 dTDP-4-amino-4,6-dideoxygalactose transaminase [Brevibacterium sanguinis]RBP73498.1 dTDP-4-amino-4,6-dideoxygalactose transaminase [Brevibacterium celere]
MTTATPTTPGTELEPVLLSPPDVGPLEEAYVVDAVRSGWIAPIGPDLTAFEAELAARAQVAHAVGLSSGTAALHLGLLGLGVGPGDIVVTSTMTFAATANAIVYCGAQPMFLDCLDDGNMDPELLHKALRGLAEEHRLPAAVVPVDLLGRAAEYDRILPVAAEFDVPVLVDAAESFGSFHGERPTASMGRAAAVSFNGNKIMTTSGGGALLTDDGELADRARYLSAQARQPVLHYEHTEVGFNYRLSNILAALGRAQLERLDAMISRRRRIRSRYSRLFDAHPGLTVLGAGSRHPDNAWLTAVLVDPGIAGFTAGDLGAWLAEDRIETRPLWKPMHLQPAFADCPRLEGRTSERLFATGLTLPNGSGMTDAQLERVLERIGRFLGGGPQGACGSPQSRVRAASGGRTRR